IPNAFDYLASFIFFFMSSFRQPMAASLSTLSLSLRQFAYSFQRSSPRAVLNFSSSSWHFSGSLSAFLQRSSGVGGLHAARKLEAKRTRNIIAIMRNFIAISGYGICDAVVGSQCLTFDHGCLLRARSPTVED